MEVAAAAVADAVVAEVEAEEKAEARVGAMPAQRLEKPGVTQGCRCVTGKTHAPLWEEKSPP